MSPPPVRNAPPIPAIGIDFSTLDTASPGSGQYRYAVDLVRGLAELRPPAAFVLLGSRAEPVPELRDVLRGAQSGWRYRRYVPRTGRGSTPIEQLRRAALAAAGRLDLLHVVHSPVPLLATVPLVVTAYDLMYEEFPEYEPIVRSRAYRWYRWGVRRRARRVIAISQATATALGERWGVPAAIVDVVPLGSGFGRGTRGGGAPPAAPSDSVGAALAGRPALVSPYNLEPRKNLAALLRAAAALRPRYPGIQVVLFGRAAVDAQREEKHARLVVQLGLQGRVHHTGLIGDSDLAWLYAAADAFVFPSLAEGFGLPVLEAMAVGGCVVCHDSPAVAEVLGDAGVLVDARDDAALAGAIAGVLDDSPRAAGFREAARRRAGSFTVERMCRETFASYRRALAPRSL